MSTKTATLAKSLHTVSVLVNVANLSPHHGFPSIMVEWAAERLGYDGAADPHGLKAKAVALLSKEAAQPRMTTERAFAWVDSH
jgi:hypothetical protein